MLRDVFYYGNKPNCHPREQYAKDLAHARELATTEHFWIINDTTDYTNFKWDWDFCYLPNEDVWAEEHNNVWPSKWNRDSGTWLCHKNHSDTIVYRTEVKPLFRKPELDVFTWYPELNEIKHIHNFRTYLVPYTNIASPYERGPNEYNGNMFPKYYITTTLEELISEHKGEIFWALNPEIDYSKFDFGWVPNLDNRYHINCFGTLENKHTQTYFVNTFMIEYGYNEINFVEDTVINISTNIDIFFIDKGNKKSNIHLEQLKSRYPNLIKTRYLTNWVSTIQRCANRSNTKLFWVVNSETDYTDFEFGFYPSPWQMNMIHVFGTQWSHWGNTYLINKDTFTEDTKYIENIEHSNVLNFVKTRRTKAVECLYDIILIDHGNDATTNIRNFINQRTDRSVIVVPYQNSYLETIRNFFSGIFITRELYFWVCSSICDYSDFDFTYICDPYSKEQLHVFPSNNQKFGDTFLVNVDSFCENNQIEKLEDIDKINYNQHQVVKRLPCPVFTVTDSQSEFKDYEYDFPYAIFNSDNNVSNDETLNVWDSKTTDILVTSTGAGSTIAPKTAREYIKGDVYDYPYIAKTDNLRNSKPLDIVFLSNGEEKADEHYERLLSIASKFTNRVVRVDGVKGRANAYHAAANASNTPWFFTVFAKLQLDPRFNFNWQPDRLQERKHYIFNARNPVNGLVYGHQALIVYNKQLVLNNPGIGLDFTLDNLHEVVNITSGVARFDTDEYSTWRTAFRECIKLKDTIIKNSDDLMSQVRLQSWLKMGEGKYGKDSMLGAKHAVEYYESVNGDMDKLKLTYEWAWLDKYYNEIQL